MSRRKINSVSDKKKKCSLVLAVQFYMIMQVYAREDGFDSSGIQDEKLNLNAKEKVIFKWKLQLGK